MENKDSYLEEYMVLAVVSTHLSVRQTLEANSHCLKDESCTVTADRLKPGCPLVTGTVNGFQENTVKQEPTARVTEAFDLQTIPIRIMIIMIHCCRKASRLLHFLKL